MISEEICSLLAIFLISSLLTLKIIPKIIQISFSKKLFDFVDERKVHTSVVPRLGGVAFTPVIIISFSFVVGMYILLFGGLPLGFSERLLSMLFILTALSFLYLEGVCDDLIGVGYRWKFLIQLLCGILVVASGLWIQNLYGFLGIYAIPSYIGMPLSIVLVIFIINAINLIDGIDGLASGLSMIALIFSSFFLYHYQDLISALLAVATIGTLIPFFGYNVFGKANMQRKIFMGDAGSQTIGLILSIIVISIASTPIDFVADATFKLSPLLFAYSLLIVPCFDVIRVMGVRIICKKSPFLPDLNHIHHRFLALGLSHHASLLVILAIAMSFILINNLLYWVCNISFIVLIDIVLWTILHFTIDRSIKRRKINKNAKEAISK